MRRRVVTSALEYGIFERSSDGLIKHVRLHRMYEGERDAFVWQRFPSLEDAQQALHNDEDVEAGTYVILPLVQVSVRYEEQEVPKKKARASRR